MAIADDVAALLNRRNCGEPDTADQSVVAAVDQITALARAYTRGRGFAGPVPNADITAVIVTAATRLAANPRQFSYEFPSGPSATQALRGGFTGWSLAELAALNRYRVRAQ